MGMYDCFIGDCPNCGKKFSVQTKLFECTLAELTVGSRIQRNERKSVDLLLKLPCYHCEVGIIAEIVGDTVLSFRKDDGLYHVKELPFGAWENKEKST